MITVTGMWYPNAATRKEAQEALETLGRYCRRAECGDCFLYPLCIDGHTIAETIRIIKDGDCDEGK